MSLSAVVLTKNEGKNIERCLSSLGWCDEIVVIDDFSEDATIERIKNHDKLIFYSSSDLDVTSGESRSSRPASPALSSGRPAGRQAQTIKIFKRHLNADFAGQRNFGLEKARGDWIFFVDADEEISKELHQEIHKIIQNPAIAVNCMGYYLKRKDYFGGRWLKYGETANVRFIRLARKGSGKWEGTVHEEWRVEGELLEFKNHLLHYPHQTVSEFLKDVNYYTDIVVQCWKGQGKRMSAWEILLYPLGKFIHNYVFRSGFRDGTAGFIMAAFMSFHSFLARSKYWLLL